ncbi:MAG: hypothetical protein IIY77_08065 [Lachnospiraceae bacterium]|nr:hypothetical protein [Lachnospiraceae bacterium]
MNEDIYAEWLVKRKSPAYLPLIYVGAAILTIIAVYLMISYKFGFIAFIIAAFGIYIGRRYLSVEYEYIFVTSELSIDRIFSQAFRKNALTIDMNMVESVEKASAGQKEQLLQDSQITYMNFTSREEGQETWFIRYNDENKGRCLLEFEPNDKVLKAMWRCSPSKVHL